MNKVSEKNILITNEKLGLPVMLISLCVSIGVLFFSFLLDSLMLGKSFIVGSITMIIYLRMQIIFGQTLGKRDLLSVMLFVLSSGRIVILGAILYLVAKRVDLFNISYTLLGLTFVQMTSFGVLIFNSFTIKKEKNMTTNMLLKSEG